MSKLTKEQVRKIITDSSSYIYCNFPTFLHDTGITKEQYQSEYYDYLTDEFYQVQFDPDQSDKYNEDRIVLPIDESDRELFFETVNSSFLPYDYEQQWFNKFEEENSGE